MPSKVNSPTVRAAIYARYSSDNPREASIEDQVEVSRRHAELQGWQIVKVYPDRALSEASRFRPVFQQMQADAKARRFEVIIVEALDRLSQGRRCHGPARSADLPGNQAARRQCGRDHPDARLGAGDDGAGVFERLGREEQAGAAGSGAGSDRVPDKPIWGPILEPKNVP